MFALIKNAQILVATVLALITVSLAFAFGPAWLGFVFLGLGAVSIGGIIYAQYRVTKFVKDAPSALNKFAEQAKQPGGIFDQLDEIAKQANQPNGVFEQLAEQAHQTGGPLDKLAEQMNQHGGQFDQLAKNK